MMKTFAIIVLSFAGALLLPGDAYAYANLICVGPTPVGDLYDTVASCNGITGIQNIFSGLVCDFQLILNDIMRRVYCGIQFSMLQPLKTALVIYIAITGVLILMGYVQATMRDLLSRMLRLMLVWIFASNAAFGIGIAYNFFIDAANQGIGWVMSTVMPPLDIVSQHPYCRFADLQPPYNIERIAFRYIDYLVCDSITGPFTENGAKVAGFIAVLSYVLPPVFVMFTYFVVKSLAIFIRCLLSYLLGISAIAFLITLSPIFLSLALFRPTYRFFDDWLRFITSFTLQIILIFAGVALWITVVTQLGQFFVALGSMVRPLDKIGELAVARAPVESWGICPYNVVMGPWGPLFMCIGGETIYPSNLINHGLFLYVILVNMLALCVVAYVFDALMKMIPQLARQLAGPSYAPQLGGGRGLGAINYLGMLKPEEAGKTARNFTERARELVRGR